MKRTDRRNAAATITVLGLLVILLSAWSEPRRAGPQPPADPCALPANWLPNTPEPHETQAPIDGHDCEFYRPAWQRFLVATQPKNGRPAFLSYPSLDQIFQTSNSHMAQAGELVLTRPRNMEPPNDARPDLQKLEDTIQASGNGVTAGTLIDQHGRPIFYAIHVNPAFAQFLREKGLTTVEGIKEVDANLEFPPGVMELKSAWMIVKNQASAPIYYVLPARVPHYVADENGTLIQATDPQTHQPRFDRVHVALLAIHVVFTLPDHPEMIWSTFEHVRVDEAGVVTRDNAPAAPSNPDQPPKDPLPKDLVISRHGFPLYRAGTKAGDANKLINSDDMKQAVKDHWDERTQSFTRGGVIQTSVYRPFPGSKTTGTVPIDSAEDSEVAEMNDNATDMFTNARRAGHIAYSDMRPNYRLVGAIWLHDPLGKNGAPSFTVNQRFDIAWNKTTDDSDSKLAGEGRLGSTSMESFTEFDGGAPNCFSCHDTTKIRIKGGALKPAKVNVSHIMSKFISERSGN